MPGKAALQLRSILNQTNIQANVIYLAFFVGLFKAPVSNNEILGIIKHLSLFHNEEVDIEPDLALETAQLYISASNEERLVYINNIAPELGSNEALKAALLSDLEQIIDSDGKICHAELTALRYVQKALTIG
jgi:hypothetical protein